MHENFEWDDQEAAHQYRLEQARYIIRAIEIDEEESGEVITRPLFVSIDENEESYTEVRTVLTDEQQRDAWLKQALRELNSWRAKYGRIKELVAIYAAMDELDKTG
jgi:hypothetical protein